MTHGLSFFLLNKYSIVVSYNATHTSAIDIPSSEGNRVFHVMSVMLHRLQIKVQFGGQADKDATLHFKHIIEVYDPFDIVHITQESIG